MGKIKDQRSKIKYQRSKINFLLLPGKTVDFKYYVMDLIWMSLKDAKKFCGGEFR